MKVLANLLDPRQARRALGWRARDDQAAIMSVEGQISSAEATVLSRLASEAPRGLDIVEIDSYRGRSACALAMGSRQGHGNRVFAVDPHAEFVGPKGGQYGLLDQQALYENILRLGLGDLIAVVSLDSLSAARAWRDRSIGLLWIDGNHRHEAVLADLEAWYPHVVEKGVIAFHDMDMEDVGRVVDQGIERGLLTPLGRVDNMAWLSKVGRDA